MEIDLNEVMIGDLHLHSKYSRATSIYLSFENLVKWAKIKGINLLGTGDFTHPIWFEEIKKLEDNGKGIYFFDGFPFVITGEISFIYTQETYNKSRLDSDSHHHSPTNSRLHSTTIARETPNVKSLAHPSDREFTESKRSLERKGRRVHLNVLVPNVEVAEKINSYLDTKGRRDYDGRPIFNISCEEFVREMKNIDDKIEIIPAHIWTPWFSMFGSKSGFDSFKECFGEMSEKVYAIETGMSSDPEMNWRIGELHNKSIVSFSDSHSFWPFRLGREATIFKKFDSYDELIRQIRENDFIGTIETDPAYGKYHYDGHRNCNFSCSFEKTKELKGLCPKCGKPLVIGVDYRVEELTTNKIGFRPQGAKPFFKLLPLHEIIVLANGGRLESNSTWNVYNDLISKFENEFNVLLKISKQEFLNKNVDDKLVELILKNREGKIYVKPGYDGEYGVAELGEKQATLV